MCLPLMSREHKKEIAMDKPMSDFHFRVMSFGYRFRDRLQSRDDILKEVGIKPGFNVLDYGCGPGSYSIAAAGLVGGSGKVYALDIHPLAVKRVKNPVAQHKLTSVKTILSDCATGLPDGSMDVVLLCDVYHSLSRPGEVLAELNRVLKTNGILAFNDHHMEEAEIIACLEEKDLFRLSKRGKRVYNFAKNPGKA